MGNAALVERLFELWREGRFEFADDLLDPQIDWLEPPETIGRNVVSGPDAVRASLSNWVDQFDSLEVRTIELREQGDRVLHAMEQSARAGGSAMDIVAPLFMVWWFRDGRAVRMEMYNDREQAEAALSR